MRAANATKSKNYRIKKKLVQQTLSMCLYLRLQSGDTTLNPAHRSVLLGTKQFFLFVSFLIVSSEIRTFYFYFPTFYKAKDYT